jgi:hypothetical protein
MLMHLHSSIMANVIRLYAPDIVFECRDRVNRCPSDETLRANGFIFGSTVWPLSDKLFFRRFLL